MSSYKNKSVENRQLSLLNLTNNSNNSKKINILYKVVKQNSSNLLKKQLRPPSEGHYNCTINEYLKIPANVEYEWIDLNKTFEIVNVNGLSYKTGIFGKMYVPRKIKPNRSYPVYLLLSRNSNVSELALFGVTLCISPSFVFDIPNKRVDLYLHLGVGGVLFGHYFWDRFMKHWFIKNLYSGSGFNISCSIDKNLSNLNINGLNSSKWNIYKIVITVKTPRKRSYIALKQALESELHTYNMEQVELWEPIQDSNMGISVENLGNNVYIVKLLLNELDVRICAPGIGIVFSPYPSELYIHLGIGTNGWDTYMRHIRLCGYSLAENVPESHWKVIKVFKVKLDKSRPFVTEIETIENGYFEGFVTSNEKSVQWIRPPIYCVKVNGTFIDGNLCKSVDNITLYYPTRMGFRKGSRIIGFVKLVTLQTSSRPSTYLSAIGKNYWVNETPPWIVAVNTTVTNTTVQPVQTPIPTVTIEKVITNVSGEKFIVSNISSS